MPRDVHDTKTRELPGMAQRAEFRWLDSQARQSVNTKADPLSYFRTRDAYMAGWRDAYRDARDTLIGVFEAAGRVK